MRRRIDQLAVERDQRIETIKALRHGRLVPSKFLDDAYQLLTGLYWSRADCSQRSHLLKVADWLIALQGRGARPGVFASPHTRNAVGR